MKLKQEKGITAVDVAISIFIIAIFVTINIGLAYNAMIKAKTIERSEKATYYAIKGIEYVKGLPYDDIVTELELPPEYQEDGYEIFVSVNRPQYTNILNTQDYIKLVSVSVSYKVASNTNFYEIKTLVVRKEL